MLCAQNEPTVQNKWIQDINDPFPYVQTQNNI